MDYSKNNHKMTIQKDKIVVVDVEATCWRGEPPPGQINEIIEIGICLLDMATLQPEMKRSILVRPERSRVSLFCTKLTTLTQDMVDGGIYFGDACDIIKAEFATETRLWASWGNYDRRIFQSQSLLFDVPYPYSPLHMNLKDVFANVANAGKKVGLMRAVKLCELSAEGTHHRGVDDAWNAAKVLGHMLSQHGREVIQDQWQLP